MGVCVGVCAGARGATPRRAILMRYADERCYVCLERTGWLDAACARCSAVAHHHCLQEAQRRVHRMRDGACGVCGAGAHVDWDMVAVGQSAMALCVVAATAALVAFDGACGAVYAMLLVSHCAVVAAIMSIRAASVARLS